MGENSKISKIFGNEEQKLPKNHKFIPAIYFSRIINNYVVTQSETQILTQIESLNI